MGRRILWLIAGIILLVSVIVEVWSNTLSIGITQNLESETTVTAQQQLWIVERNLQSGSIEAAESLLASIVVPPQRSGLYDRLAGIIAYKQSNYILAQAIWLDICDINSMIDSAEHFAELKQYSEANGFYEAALDCDLTQVARNYMSYLVYDSRQYDKAVTVASDLLLQTTNTYSITRLTYLRAEALRLGGFADASIQDYLAAIQLDDREVSHWVGLAKAYRDSGDRSQAIQAFLEATERFPNSSLPEYELALGYYEWEEPELVVEAYTSALAKYSMPTEQYVWRAGWLYNWALQPALAERTLRTALTYYPNDPSILSDLALVYRLQGDLSTAQETILNAITFGPDNPAIQFRAGLIHAEMGLETDARNYYEQALKLQPDYPEAQNALEELNIQ